MNIEIINTQKVLSATQITIADYAINPYRGCEFGCLYCYSQSNKNIKKNDFSSSLGIKINAPKILSKELRYRRPKRILLGTTTECFQYQERKLKITGKILQMLNDHKIPYTILTKSPFITDYLNLISQNEMNKIYFTLNFVSDKMIRLLEPRAPSLDERIHALNQIIAKKIKLRVHIGPFIPYLYSLDEILKIIPEGINEVDIEIYNKKQGNFDRVMKIIEQNIDPSLSKKIKSVYASRESYCAFTDSLGKTINQQKNTYPFKFFYLVPDFDNFYTPYLNYEKAHI